MKRIIFIFALSLFTFAVAEAAPISATGKVSTTQNGNGTITIHCNWHWWKTCFEWYLDGTLILGDGRIFPATGIVSIDECPNEDACDYSTTAIFSVSDQD
jgi:hypothetical protein